MKPHRDVHNDLMKDPGYKKSYDDLEIEYKLRDAIFEQRIKKGVTQKDLAKKVGTKQSAIARFESGNSNPTFAFVQKLADALGLKFDIKTT